MKYVRTFDSFKSNKNEPVNEEPVILLPINSLCILTDPVNCCMFWSTLPNIFEPDENTIDDETIEYFDVNVLSFMLKMKRVSDGQTLEYFYKIVRLQYPKTFDIRAIYSIPLMVYYKWQLNIS